MGERIGAYRILSVLGKGGMGVVYEARHERLRHDVAIKLMSGELVENRELMERFRREARAQANVAHPNVVVLHEMGEEDGVPFLVFELVKGGSLAERLKGEGRFPWREAASLGAKIARGLGAVHTAGLVHRDLKPANVLLTPEGEPKLTDFGLVGAESASLAASRALTKTGEIVGTLAYMAPEQAEGKGEITASADLYSLGALLYALLVGSPPFEGTGYELLKKHMLDRPRPPREIAPEVPESFERLVLSLLEKRPEKRPVSAGEAARALSAIAKERGEEPRSRRLVLIVAAVASLSIAAALAHLALSSPGETRPPDDAPKPGTTARPSPKDEARAALERGFALKGKHDHAAAFAAFGRAVELDPRLAAAWRERGIARGRRGDAKGAEADLAKALEIDPRDAEAWAARSTTRSQRGDMDGTIDYAKRAIALDAKNFLAWINLGAATAAKGDLDGALADLDRAVELAPRDAAVWLSRGALHANRGELDLAVADLDRAIELEPRDAVAWTNRGVAKKKKGDLDGAIADLTQGLALEPDDPASLRSRGYARQKKGDVEGALADLRRFLELAPDDPDAPGVRDALAKLERKEAVSAAELLERADQLITKGEHDAAIADATRAIELDAKNAYAWLLRATARQKKGDLDGAFADLTRAIELDGRYAQAWKNRGTARLVRGDLDGAVADYTRAVELAPGDAAAWADRALARAKKGETDGALADYAKAIELDPRSSFAYENRATARSDKGDLEGAIADCAKAIELAPDATVARTNRASYLLDRARQRAPGDGRTADVDAAIADLAKVVELSPRSGEAHLNLGTARREKGDVKGAIADYERFLELTPGDPRAKKVRALLEDMRRGR